jgi:hypothetical protein
LTAGGIVSVGYEDADGILEVEFSSGTLHEYYRVPRRVFDSLLSSSPPGQYLAVNGKDVYQYRHVR